MFRHQHSDPIVQKEHHPEQQSFSFLDQRDCFRLYNELSILKEEDENKRNIRLTLADITGKTIQHAFSLLGIVSPNKM